MAYCCSLLSFPNRVENRKLGAVNISQTVTWVAMKFLHVDCVLSPKICYTTCRHGNKI